MATTIEEDLRARMSRDQRHRLLQGYPMAPLTRGGPEGPEGCFDHARPLLVGVLPHPFCNPKVEGCGFCTFPHERFAAPAAREIAALVAGELEALTRLHPGLRARRVEGVYFGGGTANLTPPDAFDRITEALTRCFDLTEAEVTLEGVPIYFLSRGEALLDRVAALPSRSGRVSMGIQTFDAVWLERMGRGAFGDHGTVARVVERAHARGLRTSGDLLVNLPGQSLEAIFDDLRRADEAGLDQICVYQLVLYEGLGTGWSRDCAMLSKKVSPEVACERWLRVREHLLARGFVQTTLTNFERREVRESPGRFVYEECSFQPWEYDALGVGPGGISTFLASPAGPGVKLVRPTNADAYRAAMATPERWTSAFVYATAEDVELLHLTRGLSRLELDLRALEAVEEGALARHEEALGVCEAEGLIEREGARLRLTPRGTFFADSVTGLLASSRARQLRLSNDARVHAMG